MRLLIATLANAFRLLLVLLGTPGRWARRRRRPPYVRFLLKGDPPYRRPLRGRAWFVRRPEPGTVASLHRLQYALRWLAKDPEVKGVVLEVEGFRAPPAKRQAVVELIELLRRAGKEVVGYAVSADNGEYELLCATDRIFMAPAGRLELTGFFAEATAMGAGLKRVGINAQFVRRGEHKTAPEVFTHEKVSEIQERMLEQILDERYQQLVQAMVRGRKLTPEDARARIDEGPFSARRALQRGLIDGLASPAELGDALHPARSTRQPSDRERVEAFSDYARTLPLPPVRWTPVRARPRVGVVAVEGVIAQGRGGVGPFGPRIAGSDTITAGLRAAVRDSRCVGIVLYVNSPGGSAIGSELILEEVRRTARKKRVLAFFDRVAASGGYMASLGAEEIWAGPHAIAGSIGVFAGKLDVSALLERLGIHRKLVTRGRNAALFSASRPFTVEERTALEAEVEETYQAFLDHVAAARRLSPEEVRARAEGRVYSARGALEARLVDRTGLFEDACRRVLELAGRPSPEYDIVSYVARPARLPMVRVLQWGSGALALWDPWLRLPGVSGYEAWV